MWPYSEMRSINHHCIAAGELVTPAA